MVRNTSRLNRMRNGLMFGNQTFAATGSSRLAHPRAPSLIIGQDTVSSIRMANRKPRVILHCTATMPGRRSASKRLAFGIRTHLENGRASGPRACPDADVVAEKQLQAVTAPTYQELRE